MRTIRILIYVDDSQFSVDPCDHFSVSELKRMIAFKKACVLDVKIDMVNRHLDRETQLPVHAVNKLTTRFLADYDEVWFFGFRQMDLPASGEPENELTTAEVEDLKNWMTTGGVLISGDHAEEDPSLPADHPDKKNHASYLCRGRALGINVPRAGHLRVWKGPPTAEDKDPNKPVADRDNRNTQEGADIQQLDDLKYQADATPQHILLVRQQLPHKLFCRYVAETQTVFPIVKLPDHAHEGALDMPSSFDPKEWPDTSRPDVIAKGTDKRFDKEPFGLISAYEGGPNSGRIVADSSWHHYLNINLRGLPRDAAGNPLPGSDLDQIAQYYENLVIWLAPKPLRIGLGYDVVFELARNPQVLEVKNAEVSILGDTARAVLMTKIGKSTLFQMFASSNFDEPTNTEQRLFELAFLGDTLAHLNPTDARAAVGATIQSSFLGTLIRMQHQELETAGVTDFSPAAEEVLSATRFGRLVAAFEEQKPLIQNRLDEMARITNIL